jgi:hypothetical protein
MLLVRETILYERLIKELMHLLLYLAITKQQHINYATIADYAQNESSLPSTKVGSKVTTMQMIFVQFGITTSTSIPWLESHNEPITAC